MKRKKLRLAFLAVILIGIIPPIWAWEPFENIIIFSLDYIDPGLDHTRNPIEIPQVGQIGHTLYFHDAIIEGYTVQILDEDETVVFSDFIEENQTSLALPSALSGTYELQIVCGDIMFYAFIEL